MTDRSAIRARAVIVGMVVAVLIAHALDPWAMRTIHLGWYEGSFVERVIKSFGDARVWLIVAIGLIAIDSARTLAPPIRDRFTRAATLLLSVVAAGLLAEGAKLVIRRMRPEHAAEGAYAFRSFGEATLSTSGLGMPSSHAAVALAAAFILARSTPRASAVLAALAALCCLGRVAAGAHYLSDVVAAAPIAYGVAAVVWRLHMRTLPRVESP